ncbi:ADP-ribose pyrophosphatase, putative [Entamoeba invadens IP1]|uniref:ADP-ribose pyrophosphatase, putative n=1 Tax=Entamoeba invadens IP1 TaxID=370355 RepID=A0A0A1U3P4_ENTIV|nr:ADP-ribose pyrophosphatase, putative [Entamoeba invadens IP1]ELP88828.1 ADP-ribose pyrophosphatase, putative [Entamoeba invadens IP1]|eukprot:XP_004255599.1 ADP-ribose pyrophosphatase, putative [Entamoeba invadens IP1]
MLLMSLPKDHVLVTGSHYRLIERTVPSHGQLQEKKCEMLSGVKPRKGVEIVPIVYYPVTQRQSQFVVINQFRPPVGYTWQFPAGLIDDGEEPERSAMRELTEETGFIGERVLRMTSVIYPFPEYSDTQIRMATILINGDDQMNTKPIQYLGMSESIFVHLVDTTQFSEFVWKKVEKNENVGGMMFSLACGNMFLGDRFSFLN